VHTSFPPPLSKDHHFLERQPEPVLSYLESGHPPLFRDSLWTDSLLRDHLDLSCATISGLFIEKHVIHWSHIHWSHTQYIGYFIFHHLPKRDQPLSREH
jgi:hypothetical protein